MSAKRNLSFLLALVLGSYPLSALAESEDVIQLPEIKSLQQLNSLELNGTTLNRGVDYTVDIQYSNDYTKAFVGYTFKDAVDPIIQEHTIGEVDGFSDVEPDYYAKNSINYAADLGWVKGMEDGSFHPKDDLKRGELVTILYRMAGEPEEEVHEFFADTDPANPAYFTKAALWAIKHGIIKGYTDPDGLIRFKGNQAITRQELAVMLYRYQGEDQGNADLTAFADGSSVGSPYLSAMKWCIEHGIITGSESKAGQVLNPKANASRAQTATMLERFNKTKSMLSLAQTEEQTEEEPEKIHYGWSPEKDEFVSFETGEPVKGVLDLNGVLYYFDQNGKLSKNISITLGGKTFAVNSEGQLKHGFDIVDNKPAYYSQFDGHMQSGKKHYDGKDYRLNIPVDETGTLTTLNGNIYCTFSDGSIAKDEELNLNGNSYYFDGNGAMVHGIYVNGFYFDQDGKKAVSRTAQINGKNYYFGPDGKIVKAQAITLPDGQAIYCDFLDGHLIDAREFKVEGEAKQIMNQIGTNLYDLFIWASQTNFTAETSHALSLPEYGELAFETRTGNCYVYAAAFYYFAYLLGYDVVYLPGKVMYDVKNRLWGEHTWTGIYDENGKLWFYDPGCQHDFKGTVNFFKVDPAHSPIGLQYDPNILYKK